MKPLVSLETDKIATWIAEAQTKVKQGKLIHYISWPESTKAEDLALSILGLSEPIFTYDGQEELTFPLMSLIKPFLLLYVLDYLDADTVFQKVGKQPSSYPFNSLEQLQLDSGFPRNPMLNSGAMVLASLLPGKNSYTRCENFRLWLNNLAKCQLSLQENIYNSVNAQPNLKNQSLIQALYEKNHIVKPITTLDTYNRICCLAASITDLAQMGLILLENRPNCEIVQELMLNCGLYEASQVFAAQFRLPTKSGVSGGVLTIVPQQGAIACYSPPLDSQGNSVAALWLIEQIIRSLQE